MNARFRFRWREYGAHVHVRMFIRQGTTGWALSGELKFTLVEWDWFQIAFRTTNADVEFLHELDGAKGRPE